MGLPADYGLSKVFAALADPVRLRPSPHAPTTDSDCASGRGSIGRHRRRPRTGSSRQRCGRLSDRLPRSARQRAVGLGHDRHGFHDRSRLRRPRAAAPNDDNATAVGSARNWWQRIAASSPRNWPRRSANTVASALRRYTLGVETILHGLPLRAAHTHRLLAIVGAGSSMRRSGGA
jgi:hypothetical protein